ncbi:MULTISPECIES: alkaline phosphatase [unclassified Schlesneria]|uniref:alkaline phosphatase n=1 Tax=unclassified Schlesneria TaxID=2762017 RepID=UPI002F19A5A4
MRGFGLVLCVGLCLLNLTERADCSDYMREIQQKAIEDNKADFGHWGHEPSNYKSWGSHSNRLIPVYTFGTLNAPDGVDLRSYTGKKSPYRSETELQRIYGRVPPDTLNDQAEYLDQTNLFQIQQAGFAKGKKYVFLVVFDGMDWQTTRAAAIYKTQRIAYTEGRGTGFHFQDYTANGTSQFGYMCTSPHNEGTQVDTNLQSVLNPGGTLFGGYSVSLGGPNAWTAGSDLLYPISGNKEGPIRHAYTDSSSSAVSMTAGIKTYNNGVNVDYAGNQVPTIAHLLQEQGISVGAVSSVPISHATPASAYAHNVHRDDYQDLTRDMIGRKSISHPDVPLPGMDVVIGGGFGDNRLVAGNPRKSTAGENFVPGNAYLTDADLEAIDVENGGKYVTSIRKPGVAGKAALQQAAERAAKEGHRLFGFYGVGKYAGHLPFATADGDFVPTIGRSNRAEEYEPADLAENPSLSDMAAAAMTVLSKNPKGFWLMVEPGDVDWANHDNNIDNSIGAVISGDAAVKTITDWVEQHSNWDESLLIVTADHGHYLVLEKPELLIQPR